MKHGKLGETRQIQKWQIRNKSTKCGKLGGTSQQNVANKEQVNKMWQIRRNKSTKRGK
jgi:hypothetical protein